MKKMLKKLGALACTAAIMLCSTVTAFAASSIVGDYIITPTSSDNCAIKQYNGTASELVIPEKLSIYYVAEIDGCAFQNNKTLESISLFDAENLYSVGLYAFAGCTALKSIVLPKQVYYLGSSAFQGCTSLESAEIVGNIDAIMSQTFYGCTSLKSVTLPNYVTTIYNYAFASCTSLEEIELPESVKTLGSAVFMNCSSLKKVVINKNVTSIGEEAFSGCDNLTIYGYSGSYAETYAEENGIPFVAVDGYTEYIYGDANGDGAVTIEDVTHIQKALAAYFKLTEMEEIICDVNLSGYVDVTDATDIQKYLAGFDIETAAATPVPNSAFV